MTRWHCPPRSEAERNMRFGFERWMDIYDCASQAWWEKAEYETMLYPAELRQYKQVWPQPTLKEHMLQTKGQPRY